MAPVVAQISQVCSFTQMNPRGLRIAPPYRTIVLGVAISKFREGLPSLISPQIGSSRMWSKSMRLGPTSQTMFAAVQLNVCSVGFGSPCSGADLACAYHRACRRVIAGASVNCTRSRCDSKHTKAFGPFRNPAWTFFSRLWSTAS